MMDGALFERKMGERRYRMVAQSVVGSCERTVSCTAGGLGAGRSAAEGQPGETRTVGTQAVGDMGALLWVAEQINLVEHIDRACAGHGPTGGPSVGEMVLAVALQRVCAAGPKRDLAQFLEDSLLALLSHAQAGVRREMAKPHT
jgi:hypothetical protein